MNRVFIGVGYADGGSDVYVEQDSQRRRLTTRRVNRMHEGYSWDQAGPRSTELARAIISIVGLLQKSGQEKDSGPQYGGSLNDD